MNIHNRLQRLEKLERTIQPQLPDKQVYKYTVKDWTLAELEEVITKLTPALVKKLKETDPDWAPWLSGISTEELRTLLQLFKENEEHINILGLG